jgi:hypothetical protein
MAMFDEGTRDRLSGENRTSLLCQGRWNTRLPDLPLKFSGTFDWVTAYRKICCMLLVFFHHSHALGLAAPPFMSAFQPSHASFNDANTALWSSSSHLESVFERQYECEHPNCSVEWESRGSEGGIYLTIEMT